MGGLIVDSKRFSFSGKVSVRDMLQAMLSVYPTAHIRQALDEVELSMQPAGWTLKEPCEGCEEKKEKELATKKRRAVKEEAPAVVPVTLEPEQEADNMTVVEAVEVIVDGAGELA